MKVILAVTMSLGALLPAPAASADTVVTPANPSIKYFGRWNTASPAAYVSEWAGAYLVTGFTGRTVKLRQRDPIDFFVSIDGGPDVAYVNRRGTVDVTPQGLRAGNHTLRVSYRPVAGAYRGDAVFGGLVLGTRERAFAPAVPSRIIEFIGDSITVGQRSSKQALTAYGWLTGEKLKMGHTQIAVGGACLHPAADGCLSMREGFLRTGLPTTSPPWSFSRYRAHAVVINLGTNDVGHRVSRQEFQTSYVTLMRRVREKYPDAVIFALQTFRGRYVTETQAAVNELAGAGDRNVVFVGTEGWIDAATDTVDGVHPNDVGHRKIADRLAPVIAARVSG
ncbi:SGNH/GDSL hydrolase family protein [Lentzea flaviverrucosa]|uniref:Lysophospholipase L1 n=1 Tax=Lentzea flaviverrucosa TaxID=200379 RepID=A0A1H9XT90_9PSEU|nr:SGNH/GDSL hydrolase family protein [Lentzea flaviverrucosa]RDI19367.1 lysophospholipase L1-like esterase [Lentzea flaviverrucosa]SES48903.1 Lysophospholipase L1 [Lentzea flaviverrucosa]